MADDRLAAIIPLPILRDPELSDHAKLVAVAIGAYMDKYGCCWPGIDTIARERGCSTRHAKRGLEELQARHHLTIQQRRRLPAVLQWLHPLMGQDDVTSQASKRGQKSTQEVTKKGGFRPQEVTIGRTQKNEAVERVLTRGGQSDRSNRNSHSTPTPIGATDWRKLLGDDPRLTAAEAGGSIAPSDRRDPNPNPS